MAYTMTAVKSAPEMIVLVSWSVRIAAVIGDLVGPPGVRAILVDRGS
jgi:hypothetical protein|tara:strand:+ start:406 stop:546 length:141 start_codon:yes stop_codon:yes gene_type:complete